MVRNQQDWVDHLQLAKFYYNNLEHLTMGATHFQMVMGKLLIMPMTWVVNGQPLNNTSEEVPMVM